MHLYITLSPVNGLELTVHYNHILQGVIYSTIDPELAAFLHDKGYVSGSRTFKLFSVSRVLGRFTINRIKNTMTFIDNVIIVISSPITEFCQSIANGLLTKGVVQMGSNALEVKEITARQLTVASDRVILKTLSPIVVYSTLLRPDGRKYTCFLQPGEPDYNTLIGNNLLKKYQALYGQDAPSGDVKIRKMGEMKMNIVNYKDTIIKGYSGRLELTGPQEMLQMAVDGGLGSKNSQGFGCVETV